MKGFQRHAQDLQDRNSGKVGRTVNCSFIEGFQRHAQDLQDRNSGKVGWTVICSFIERFQRHAQGLQNLQDDTLDLTDAPCHVRTHERTNCSVGKI